MRHRKLLSKYMALTLCASMTLGCMVTSDNVYANETNITSETEEEWNLKAIEADYISEETVKEENKVKVAVLDSGIDFSENVNVVERKDFTGEDISPLYEDATGHGTAVAAVIGASGEGDTIKGINPDVEIYSAKILDENNRASIDKVVNAIEWAIEKKVNIINMSFSKKSDSATLHNAIKRAYNAGILMVASTGNEGSSDEDNVEYPAAYKEVVAVGAVTPEGKLSDMTSTGKELELLAPGEYIKTTGWLDIENVSSGTSFATPHVTGVASLLWQKDLTKSADFIRKLLVASAKTITEEDGKEYSLVDYEYACKIYDEYNEQYTENDDVEELTEEFENESEAEDYSDEVEGRWAQSNHEVCSDGGAKYTGVDLSSATAKIFKLGATYPDKNKNDSITLYGMGENPQWHGNFYKANYFACFIYATKLALAGGNKNNVDVEFSRYQNDYNIMSNKVNQYGVCGKTWESILSDFNYSNKSVSVKKLYRKYFIYGMAMHIATDIFAHSAYDVNYRHLSHNGYDGLTEGVNYADKTTKLEKRWYAAQAVAKEIFCSMYSGLEGSLLDFTGIASKYYDGSFYLGNVMWYADGVNIAAYGTVNYNTLVRLGSGRYVDDYSQLPGGLSY